MVLAISLLSAPLFAGNDKDYTYLALGDSVAYGLDPTLLPTGPGQPVPSPADFIGYPEVYAAAELFDQTNDIYEFKNQLVAFAQRR